MSDPTATRPGRLTIYTARRIHTMDETLPLATAVGVIDDRIVAVGDLASMDVWREGREVVVDERLKDKVLMPGFIDNHLHPYLGALLTPMEIIAPEPWRLEGGRIAPAATTPARYLELLKERLKARPDKSDWFITFGYQPAEHGHLTRVELDALCPDRPVILWHRSFHESFLNTAAIEKLGITAEIVAGHPQIDFPAGRFYETGNKVMAGRLLPYLLRPEWFHKGLKITAELMQRGGITTACDMMFGALNLELELEALDACIEKPQRPLRIVNVCDARSFSNRTIGKPVSGVPSECPPFEQGIAAIDAARRRGTHRIRFSKAVKLFADGAMFSQTMQMKPPGYLDGHPGEWLMTPEVVAEGVRVFWDAGYQINMHVNGDAGMDAVLDALAAAQERKPRFDHRFTMQHVGFHTNAQSRRMAALGACASVNPFFIHALADTYGLFGLGPERASQLVRAGSLLRNGVRVSLHSDFMMAPTEPLTLAWCVAARTTRSGKQVAIEECLTVYEAMRAITIDAAFALRMDDEIGSIVTGKKADFTVLEDDPFEFGAKRLKDVRVAGTVFEGEVHLLDSPAASSLAEVAAPAAQAAVSTPAPAPRGPQRGRYRLVGDDCTVQGDPCGFMRQFTGWAAAVAADQLRR
ncbi:MAG TPA: amidohydrolase [Burkholderiaceae bacterium]|jgi:hypothetical protein